MTHSKSLIMKVSNGMVQGGFKKIKIVMIVDPAILILKAVSQ